MNELEIPQDYNNQDSFYQNKLLKSIENNNSSENLISQRENMIESKYYPLPQLLPQRPKILINFL